LALATPVAGRDRPELAEMIGPLLNTVAIRLSLAANPTVAEALAIVRAQVLGALAHQELPFDEVVTSLGLARGGGSPPWLAALLAVQNLALPALDFGALEAEPLEVEKQAVQFELVAFFAERQGGLAGGFNYRSDLFDRTTIERWRGWLERLLEGVATRPEARAWDLPWWSPAEHQQLLCEWSESRRLPEAGPEEGPWCLFAAACRRAPERVGVVFEGEHWSYGALAARAAGGAAELEAFGVGPEQLVAICLERSVALVVAVLSVLGAGAAYVPLDPAWPRERLASLLTELGHPWVLSGPLERELLPANARALEPARVPAEPVPAPLPDARQLAYLIYTSGSTGRPKGVMISRGSAAHLARSQVVAFGLGEGERVLQFSAITFDASVSELLTAWAVAGTLVLGRREQLADSGELAGLASRERIDLVTLPPSLLARLAAGSLPAQTTLVVAGEATSAELVDRWAPGRRMLNAYGPTECTVGATVGLCEVGAGAPPALGRPTRGYRLHVV
ncbi:MAG TPA: AMP-binding protein, partial [Thermoanaerobaculia bacterium]|nr:AMP-binding protein [Thermoanaerobaculia bacterium]